MQVPSAAPRDPVRGLHPAPCKLDDEKSQRKWQTAKLGLSNQNKRPSDFWSD
jgi:hypothetical protein